MTDRHEPSKANALYDGYAVSGADGETAACTCAAAEYAERWLFNTYGGKIAPGEERRYVDGMAAFIAGYHVAIHLVRTALHDVPDAAGNINVAEPDAIVN